MVAGAGMVTAALVISIAALLVALILLAGTRRR
jgi:hypothetical protein